MNRPLCVALLAASAISVLRADVVTLSPLQDTSIYEELPANANGAGTSFFAGNTAGGHTRRGLLQFDLTGALPAGAIIEAVTLRLHLDQTNSGAQTVALHRLLASWGEGSSDGTGQGGPADAGEATWTDRTFDTVNWTTSGGDFAGTASATTLVGPGSGQIYSWTGSGLVSDVALWLAQPTGNFGWIVRGNEAQSRTAMRFTSRESEFLELRPELVVTFTAAIPEPGTSALLLGGAAVLAAGLAQRRRPGGSRCDPVVAQRSSRA